MRRHGERRESIRWRRCGASKTPAALERPRAAKYGAAFYQNISFNAN
jgi:hypothetical protein